MNVQDNAAINGSDQQEETQGPGPVPARITAPRLLAMGFQPVECRGKEPRLKGWQKKLYNEEAIKHDFGGLDVNVRIMLGRLAEVGDWIGYGAIDVDMETRTVAAVAPFLLPSTGFGWGRKSKPHSHRVYAVKGEHRTKKVSVQSGS